jgi:hypothetical protein
MHNRYILSLTLLLITLTSCQSDTPPAGIEHSNLELNGAERVIDTTTDDRFAMPSSILATPEGLYVYDFGAGVVHRFDENYQLIQSFGNHGNGPEEFQYLASLWVFDDEITSYDPRNAKLISYSFDGDFINEQSLSSQQYSQMMAAGSVNDFYFQSGGLEGSLLTHSNLSNESIHHFGESLTSDDQDISISTTRQAIEREQVPSFMMNRVMPAVNSERIFAFQLATGFLQAYNHNYELQWEHLFATEFMDEVFENYIEANRIMLDRGNIIFLMYASHLVATEDGVAILFNTPEGTPVTIGWMNNEGTESGLISYTDLEINSQNFSISADRNTIYFNDQLEGEIWRVEWPF